MLDPAKVFKDKGLFFYWLVRLEGVSWEADSFLFCLGQCCH